MNNERIGKIKWAKTYFHARTGQLTFGIYVEYENDGVPYECLGGHALSAANGDGEQQGLAWSIGMIIRILKEFGVGDLSALTDRDCVVIGDNEGIMANAIVIGEQRNGVIFLEKQNEKS